MAGDPDEDAARATLAEMQMRLVSGPHAVLAIAPGASASEARSAFLELTKLYHPARYGRMSTDLQRLANEVFLGIKAAHETLAKTSGWATRGQPSSSQPATMRPQTALPSTGLRAPTSRPAHPTPMQPNAGPPTGPLRTGGPVQPSAGPPTGPLRTGAPSQPAPTQPSGPHRAATPSQPVASSQSGPARPAQPGRASTPSPVVPSTRPSTPAPVAPSGRSATATPLGVPVTPAGARPATPQPWKAPAPASGPARAATPPPAAAGAVPARPQAGAFDERAELTAVMDLVRKGQWPAARQGLQTLAARVPASTNYKALLSYARAREAQMAGRVDEAILELQRALQLDPNLALAKSALAEMQSRKR